MLDWRILPDFRGRMAWVKVRVLLVVNRFLQEYLADEELTGWNLNQAFLYRHLLVHTDLSACFVGLGR